MSTKTMRPPSRPVPLASGSTKHKERDDGFKRPKKSPTTTTTTKKSEPMSFNNKGSKPMSSNKGSNSKPMSYNNNNKGSKPISYSKKGSGSKRNNQLLAGYLAHEYLTKGTLLGKRWDHLPSQRVEPQQEEKQQRYMELACLLKTDGTHMSGIVNPTQLARSLRLL